ncbi:hypothetical protein CMO92_00235 [Candidatus Woesearchaeota archaeon]|nr:hypothetical protein [Candidatus Woesearchaeota archaeon]|tara:strand:+ start:275 stop:1174 length:900 start_codon:yes stop_codon:yes gene_type:complete
MDERYQRFTQKGVTSEENAVWRVGGSKSVKTFVGVGALLGVEHCLRLGFPDHLLLFDPLWKREVYSPAKEMDGVVYCIDQNQPMNCIRKGADLDVYEFFFEGVKKSVYFFKELYRADLIKRFSVDVFHVGHRSVTVERADFLDTMMVLPEGAIILNYFRTDRLDHHIFSHFFFRVEGSYVDNEGVSYCVSICMKNVDRKRADEIFTVAGLCGQLLRLIPQVSRPFDEQKVHEESGIPLEELRSMKRESRDSAARVRKELQIEGKKLDDEERGHVRRLIMTYKTDQKDALTEISNILRWK